jgi:hypothetical protein
MLVSSEEAAVHPFQFEDLAAARIDELRGLGGDPRRALPPRRPSRAVLASRRSLRALGFLLIGAGLRLALAAEGRRRARRSLA